MLGWRKWEFTDWVFANSEFVWDYQDPSVIDNSLGRVEWFAKYNLAWNDSNFTLEDFLKSDFDTSFLAQKWIENYIYNTLTLGELLNRIDYWKRYILGGTSAWKWLYSKKIRLT